MRDGCASASVGTEQFKHGLNEEDEYTLELGMVYAAVNYKDNKTRGRLQLQDRSEVLSVCIV